MADYLIAEDLGFGMASPERYRRGLVDAGFIDVALRNRNAWCSTRRARSYGSWSGWIGRGSTLWWGPTRSTGRSARGGRCCPCSGLASTVPITCAAAGRRADHRRLAEPTRA